MGRPVHLDERVLSTRGLTRTDKEAALDLLGPAIAEVPVYRWLLGEDLDHDVARWYAEVMFSSHVDGGISGTFDDAGLLCGIMVTTHPDRSENSLGDDLRARSVDIIRSIPGFVRRYQELQDNDALSTPAGRFIGITFGAVEPHTRKSGLLGALLDPVFARADSESIPVVARTADPALLEVYQRKFGAVIHGEFTVSDGPTVAIVRRDPR